MIVNFVLFVVLFAAASLGWGFISFSSRTGLPGRTLLWILFLVTVSAVLSSVFFLRGISGPGGTVGQVAASLVVALGFVLSLLSGFSLAASSEMAGVFSYLGGLWKGEKDEKDRSGMVDEILDRVAQSVEIDVLEKELIESILKFKDKIVREVMVPRGDIVAIDLEDEPRHVLRKVAEEGYSRMPAYRGSVDNIVGIIYAKDLITMAEGSGAIVLQDLLRTPYYVPESKKISQLLREMQRNKVHLAVVVDEFGGTEGIVTLEDVLEEIVGEIQDEYDESLSEVTRDEKGDVFFAGSMTVDRFNELLEGDIPSEEDYDTMAGFVQKLAGKLPQEGEVYNYGEMFFVIEEVARHRIKRLKMSFKEHPRSEESDGIDVALDPAVEQTSTDAPAPTEPGIVSSSTDSEHNVPSKRKSGAKRGTSRKSPSARQKKAGARPGRGGMKKR